MDIKTMGNLVSELSDALQTSESVKTQLHLLMTAVSQKNPVFTEHYYRRFTAQHEAYLKASQNFIRQVNRLAINNASTTIDEGSGR